MENETENINSANDGKDEVNLDEIDDISVLKEKYKELDTKLKDVSSKNSQLFERTKKAEGFEKDEKGDWIKSQKSESKSESKPKEAKSDDKLIERLDKLALNVAGIKEADEVELFDKWKEDTGREADEIVGNEIFKKELENLRTARANQEATSDVKGEAGTSGAKDNPDYWIAKATKGKDGKLEFPEETPKELYSKILDKLSKDEPGSNENLKFYNE